MRPVFVGDVQGCADELEELVARCEAAFGAGFELWLAGDLLNRGPGNRRVLELVHARRAVGRARVVLGNHDLAFVRTLYGLRPPGAHDTLQDLVEHSDAEGWAEWIRRLPLVEAGRLGSRRFAMVHASVHPDWSLEELCARAAQVEAILGGDDLPRALALLAGEREFAELHDCLERLTRCRSVTPDGRWSSRVPGEAEAPSLPWHEPWREARHDYAVVYGHWAMQGLHVESGLRGLDTGCVHHGRDHDGFLTAWLPDPSARDPFRVPDDGFWQVRAHRRYYPESPSAPAA